MGQRQGVDLRVFCGPHGDGLLLHDRDSASLTVATVCQSHAIRSMIKIEMLLLRKFWFVQTSQCIQATRSARRHMSTRGNRGDITARLIVERRNQLYSEEPAAASVNRHFAML